MSKYSFPKEQPISAQLQVRIGETAHAKVRQGSRNDWADAAYFVMYHTRTPDVTRWYKNRGIKWRALYKAADQIAA